MSGNVLPKVPVLVRLSLCRSGLTEDARGPWICFGVSLWPHGVILETKPAIRTGIQWGWLYFNKWNLIEIWWREDPWRPSKQDVGII